MWSTVGLGATRPWIERQHFRDSQGILQKQGKSVGGVNDIDQQLINEVRGQHPVFVFTGPDGKSRVHHMRNRAWKKARAITGLPIRVHDLKHYVESRIMWSS